MAGGCRWVPANRVEWCSPTPPATVAPLHGGVICSPLHCQPIQTRLDVGQDCGPLPKPGCKLPSSAPHLCSRDGAKGEASAAVRCNGRLEGRCLQRLRVSAERTTLLPTLQRRAAAAAAAKQPAADADKNRKDVQHKPAAKRQRKAAGSGGGGKTGAGGAPAAAAAPAAAQGAGQRGQQFFLMKSEPDVFSIDDLAARPQQTEPWDGAPACFVLFFRVASTRHPAAHHARTRRQHCPPLAAQACATTRPRKCCRACGWVTEPSSTTATPSRRALWELWRWVGLLGIIGRGWNGACSGAAAVLRSWAAVGLLGAPDARLVCAVQQPGPTS